ncbi:hypothetical protein E1301_Tti018832 [Triplophysa tibetana]|uniref:Immunoglobulin V-set domain-containing protein n=1 Tax=Triplophysa tibetana TaxID=1572043 RepID=A0A5A9P814_9TELE|nr:hypothetical protein E1301_Tti018832 [Triplophysa tibetana]
MAAGYFFAFSIFLISNTGSSDEDTMFVQTGASVQLDIQRDMPAVFTVLSWKNDKDTLVEFSKFYFQNHDPDKVDFNNKTCTLTLKNLQKNDSGVYKAQIPGKPNINVAEYTVTVIDAVKAPGLTVISNSSSSNSCTVSFTCTGHDLTLNSTYTNSRCSPEDVTSLNKYTLILICSENNIICNQSNPVSWKTESTDTEQFCEVPEKPATHQDSRNWSNLVIGCVGGCVVLVSGLALAIYCYWKRHKGGRQDFNTVYNEVGHQPMETIRTESHTYDVPDRTPAQTREEKESNTIYHMVGQPPNQPLTIVTEHTIYSQVCKQPPVKRPDT